VPSLRTHWAGALLAALAVVAVGCGEKSEPDVSELPPPPQPQPQDPPPGLPRAVVGQWEGTLHQRDTKPFAIGVRIVSATQASRNVVNYGGEIDCSGTWTYLSTEGSEVRFRERIDRGGSGECKGAGNVTVRALEQPGRLAYEFQGGGVTSRGTLERRVR